jgi:hypothetical protein
VAGGGGGVAGGVTAVLGSGVRVDCGTDAGADCVATPGFWAGGVSGVVTDVASGAADADSGAVQFDLATARFDGDTWTCWWCSQASVTIVEANRVAAAKATTCSARVRGLVELPGWSGPLTRVAVPPVGARVGRGAGMLAAQS